MNENRFSQTEKTTRQAAADNGHVPPQLRLLHLLTLIAGRAEPPTAKDLAVLSGYPLSSVYRYLAHLKDWGFVRELSGSGRYAAGPRAVQLWANFRRNFDLGAVARPVMEDLSERLGETVLLVIPVGVHAVCIEAVESPLKIRYSFQPGVMNSLDLGASAKCMLPFLERTVYAQIMQRIEREDPRRKADLEKEVEEIRRQGYACTEGEVDPGAWAVGVPIFSAPGYLEGALSVVAPSFRIDDAKKAEIIAQARETVQRIHDLIASG